MHCASDGASETCGKIFLAENQWYPGRRFGREFRGAYTKIEAISISAALPGAQPWKGVRPQPEETK